MSSHQYRELWKHLQKKYGLPYLNPVDLRHWVATAFKKNGLCENARAYMQGHDMTSFDRSMGAWYNNEQLEVILEEQRAIFPNGPLATLFYTEVELVSDIPPDVIALIHQFLEGEIGVFDAMHELEDIKMKMANMTKLDKIGIV